MEAAGRLRERHGAGSSSDGVYTLLHFRPSDGDWADFLLIAPYCDLAFAFDADGRELTSAPADLR
jgi:hypothetical protein